MLLNLCLSRQQGLALSTTFTLVPYFQTKLKPTSVYSLKGSIRSRLKPECKYWAKVKERSTVAYHSAEKIKAVLYRPQLCRKSTMGRRR
jgi:hypothetical protein